MLDLCSSLSLECAAPLGVAAAGFNPTTLFGGTAGAYYNIADITTLFKDTAGAQPVTADNDPVARVNDKSGNNNHLLLIGAAAARPLYKANAGLPYLLTDAVDDYLRADFTMGTTWDRIAALRVVAFQVADEAYFGGGGAASDFISIYGNGSNQLVLQSAAGDGPVIAPTVNTDFVMTERRQTAPCAIALDNGSYVTSPSIAGSNPQGVTVGARRSGSDFSNQRFYGMVMIDRALTGGEIASCRTFMGALQGRVL